ncbi:hypothetical protein Nepgr_016314 [Nepenthes gracilis]|uniref:Uncharacterized protein n=1 Tax=Nepenthes gracilis TaxID=150966 RepID=A0AAD3XRI1_NEPGR|nr:hypothetical protein Nepgr_016314 [Nepenthes gracilis]
MLSSQGTTEMNTAAITKALLNEDNAQRKHSHEMKGGAPLSQSSTNEDNVPGIQLPILNYTAVPKLLKDLQIATYLRKSIFGV